MSTSRAYVPPVLLCSGLVERPSTMFRTDAEIDEFAKKLAPEEAFKIGVYNSRFHMLQMDIEVTIEKKKQRKAEKSESKLREYTRDLANGVPVRTRAAQSSALSGAEKCR